MSPLSNEGSSSGPVMLRVPTAAVSVAGSGTVSLSLRASRFDMSRTSARRYRVSPAESCGCASWAIVGGGCRVGGYAGSSRNTACLPRRATGRVPHLPGGCGAVPCLSVRSCVCPFVPDACCKDSIRERKSGFRRSLFSFLRIALPLCRRSPISETEMPTVCGNGGAGRGLQTSGLYCYLMWGFSRSAVSSSLRRKHPF